VLYGRVVHGGAGTVGSPARWRYGDLMGDTIGMAYNINKVP
jgi:hypothetical protein